MGVAVKAISNFIFQINAERAETRGNIVDIKALKKLTFKTTKHAVRKDNLLIHQNTIFVF